MMLIIAILLTWHHDETNKQKNTSRENKAYNRKYNRIRAQVKVSFNFFLANHVFLISIRGGFSCTYLSFPDDL